jgi:hypothetical protein
MQAARDTMFGIKVPRERLQKAIRFNIRYPILPGTKQIPFVHGLINGYQVNRKGKKRQGGIEG